MPRRRSPPPRPRPCRVTPDAAAARARRARSARGIRPPRRSPSSSDSGRRAAPGKATKSRKWGRPNENRSRPRRGGERPPPQRLDGGLRRARHLHLAHLRGHRRAHADADRADEELLVRPRPGRRLHLHRDLDPPNCAGGEATEEQIAAIEEQLELRRSRPFIDKFYFEDHDQAYENFQKQFEGNPVADYVTPDQLNQTFWVNLIDPSQSAVLVESLAGMPGVEGSSTNAATSTRSSRC